MPFQASHKFARIPPRKCRLVADLIRGKDYQEAQAILHFTINKSARLVEKVMQSAYHNAVSNERLSSDRLQRLYVSKVWVDEAGSMGIQGKLKRYQPRAQGRPGPILKRASHIHVELDERPY